MIAHFCVVVKHYFERGDEYMTGNEVKQLIQNAGLKCWQVAELWGVNDGNFSRRLRRPFNDAEIKRIKEIIAELTKKETA